MALVRENNKIIKRIDIILFTSQLNYDRNRFILWIYIIGTLCNACGVKWKQGKILQGPNASRTAEGDTNNTAQNSKTRKNSLTTPASPARSKKKSGRSLSMSEGALTYVGNDDGRDKDSETSGVRSSKNSSQRIGFDGTASAMKG